MKTTDKQIAANRRNATLSTGPVTKSGKAVASRNALKHGLLAKEIIIDGGEGAESHAEFDAVLLALKNQFDPQGPLEKMLVEKIAVAYWRLRRAHRYEVGLIRRNVKDAVEQYYKADPLDSGRSRLPDDQIDAKVTEAKELHQAWQDDRNQFTKMRKAGKDLQEIYDSEDNWDWVFDKASETVDDVSDESPASMRASLNAAGWTDDDIWQCHIDVCAEQMESQAQTIRELQKQKQDNQFALQVQKKIGSIPGGYDLERLLKYEGSIEKQFYKAIDQLERLQRMRTGDQVPPPVNIDLSLDAENPG